MALDKAAVAHIAALARIGFPRPSSNRWRNELSQILTWVEQLNEVDTSAVAPMASVAASGLPMREDRVTDGNCREAILGNAPRTAPSGGKAGFFAVPKVIE